MSARVKSGLDQARDHLYGTRNVQRLEERRHAEWLASLDALEAQTKRLRCLLASSEDLDLILAVLPGLRALPYLIEAEGAADGDPYVVELKEEAERTLAALALVAAHVNGEVGKVRRVGHLPLPLTLSHLRLVKP